MHTLIARRDLLAGFSVSALGALFGTSTLHADESTSERVLVCIFMRGAADGLSLCVPYTERAYYAERSSIAIAAPGSGEGVALQLDGQFGLHPRLARSCRRIRRASSRWCTPSAAALYTLPLRRPDDMESGQPVRALPRRLAVARAVAAPAHSLERSIALGPRLPRALSGEAPSLLLKNLASFDLHGPRRSRALLRQGFERLYAGTAGAVGQVGARRSRHARHSTPRTEALCAGKWRGLSTARAPAARRSSAHQVEFGVQVVWLDVPGWDTHAGQGGAEGGLAKRLDQLARSLAAFSRRPG